MSVIDPTLREMFDGWQGYQDRMLKAVQALNDDQLTLGVSPELRPVRRLLMHVVATRVRWLASTGLQVSPETAPLGEWNRTDIPEPNVAALLHGLEASWALVRAALDQWTPEDLQKEFTRPWRGQDITLTRQWIVWHLIEHDLHHGGELSYTLGMNSIPGIEI
jgi:uncharacterized damage-inducible protein DinB